MKRHVSRQEKQRQDLRTGPIQFLEIYTPTTNFDEVGKKGKKSSNSSILIIMIQPIYQRTKGSRIQQ